jgi:DNA-binding transcriptional regulator YhcF (GntR family)/DNA-binding LacI/PurR family transcriptional regulator
MQRKNKPDSRSLNCALEFLADGFSKGVWRDGDRLPPLKQLAAKAKVKAGSMSAALAALAREGKVTVRRKSGIYAGVRRAEPSTISLGQKWLRTKVQIQRDILEGHFASERSLPSLADLQHRYNVCYSTIHKSLVSLAEEGVLRGQGGGYVVPGLPGQSSRASLMYIGFGDLSGKLTLEFNRIGEIIQTLKKTAELRCLDLTLFGLHARHDTGRSVSELQSARRKVTPIGYIIVTFGFAYSTFVGILESIAAEKKPIAIFDEKGGLVLPRHLADLPNIRIFSIAGISAGKAVGHYLARQGHRHIGYLNPFHGELWSKQRLAGLRQSMTAANPEATVDPFIADLPDQYDTFFLTHLISPRIPSAIKRLKSDFLRQFGYSDVMQHLITEVFNQTTGILQMHAMHDLMRPLVERIVADSRLTAWVCANDSVAIIAKELVRRMKKTAARSISMVGFDDSIMAYIDDITSYNFNFGNIALRMMFFILNPPSVPAPLRGNTAIECDGFIMLRASSHPPRH